MDAQLTFLLFLASQTFLLSWYLPKRIQSRMRYVFDHYPFAEYPKLYDGDLDKAQKNYRRHIVFNNVMLVVGVGLIVAVYYYGEQVSSGLLAMVAFIFGMTQSIPLILMDLLMLRQCKRLNAENTTPQRSASLTRRSIFNHTSMMLLAVTVSFILVSMLFDMYTKSFDLSLGFELFEAVIILTAVNLFFAFMIRWRVYGKKLNPLLSEADNIKEITAVVQSSLYTSIAVSIFFMTMRAVNVYDLEQFEGVLMSAYMQAIFLLSVLHSLKQVPIESMNLENFRADKV